MRLPRGIIKSKKFYLLVDKIWTKINQIIEDSLELENSSWVRILFESKKFSRFLLLALSEFYSDG